MNTLTFTVPGMTCGHCESAVKAEIGKVVGVTDVDVYLETKAVVVRGTDLSVDEIFAAVDEAGFEPTGIESAGIEPTEFEPAGIESAEIESAGIESAGIETSE